MCEGHKVGDEEGGDCGEQHEDEEWTIAAQHLPHPTAEHTGQHHAEIHDSAGQCVVRHLIFAGSYLLHHKEGQAHETETVAEIFDGNTATDQPQF